jgi:hypothetical protein
MRVFVLLFNAGTENEGIHTLKLGDRNIVLMFESEEDAERYGVMLEAQDFSVPTIEEFESEEIEDFCQGAQYEWKLIEEGALELPPETNVEQPDWSPEVDRALEPEPVEKSEFSASELDALRRRFEGLL